MKGRRKAMRVDVGTEKLLEKSQVAEASPTWPWHSAFTLTLLYPECAFITVLKIEFGPSQTDSLTGWHSAFGTLPLTLALCL